MTINLDKNDFRAWLKRQSSDAVVGLSNHLTSCPVATWQREGFDNVISVSADTVVSMETGDESFTPKWVEIFIQEIDDRHADEGENGDMAYYEEPVTVRECLDVLTSYR